MSISYKGLSAEQVAANRQRFGANVITFAVSPTLAEMLTTLNASWQVKWLFRISFILLLLLSFVEVIGINLLQDAWYIYLKILSLLICIYLLLLALTCVRYWLKYREARLQQQIADQKGLQTVRAIRNGHLVMLERRDVVVRDVLILQQGDEIPADGYLLDSCDMLVNESMFSGNARCVKSTDHADFDFSAQFATDHLVGGSWVLEGEGIMEVTAVGEPTALASMLRKRVDDSESVLRLKLLFI
jgi:Ca2+-transporting ATPase